MNWVAAATKPDADIAVLLWVHQWEETHIDEDWMVGFWDGSVWRDVVDGEEVRGVITHWADVPSPVSQ